MAALAKTVNQLGASQGIYQRRRGKEIHMEFEGYCVKCREKRMINEGTVGETSKGQPMARGTCPECGATVTRFLPKNVAYAEEDLGTAMAETVEVSGKKSQQEKEKRKKRRKGKKERKKTKGKKRGKKKGKKKKKQ